MKLLIAILLFSLTASGQTYITQISTRCCNPSTFQDTTWSKVGNDSIYKRVNGLIVATGIKKTKTFIPYSALPDTVATKWKLDSTALVLAQRVIDTALALKIYTDNKATALAASTAATYATITTVNGKENTIAPGTTAQYRRGDNTWQTLPAGSGYTTVILASDITNSTVTIADVTALSFPVTSGVTYKFRFYIIYTSAATTTGSRWSINGPATTLLNYTSRYTLTATTQTQNFQSTYNVPAAANASSLTVGNCAIIEGVITPSTNGTVICRFASEVAASAIVAKVKSYVEYQVQ